LKGDFAEASTGLEASALSERRRALSRAVAVALGVHITLALGQGVSAWVTASVGIGASALHGVVGTLTHAVAPGWCVDGHPAPRPDASLRL
jgi:hypothetical protein